MQCGPSQGPPKSETLKKKRRGTNVTAVIFPSCLVGDRIKENPLKT